MTTDSVDTQKVQNKDIPVKAKKSQKTKKTQNKKFDNVKDLSQSIKITEVINTAIPEDSEYVEPKPKTRVLFCGTHPNQTNGYSKVVMQLMNRMAKYEDFDITLWGFQSHLVYVGRPKLPEEIKEVNVNLIEMQNVQNPEQRQKLGMHGFGERIISSFLKEQPYYDIIIIYNDVLVTSRLINQIENTKLENGKSYLEGGVKLLYYFDQVYQNQIRNIFSYIDSKVHGYIAFTKYWGENLSKYSSKPYFVVEHGFSNDMIWKVPQKIARSYWQVPEDDFVILNLNRNQPRKKWDLTMMAFVHVLKTLREKRLKQQSSETEPTTETENINDDNESIASSISDINVIEDQNKNTDNPDSNSDSGKTYDDTNIKLFVGTQTMGSFNLVDIYVSELKRAGLDPEEYMDRIHWIGQQGQALSDFDINALYNIADLGINTADGEGFGLCNFEQGCIKIPQVLTLTGGFRDFIDTDWCSWSPPSVEYYRNASGADGIFGLAEVSTYYEYADCILQYIKNPQLCQQHGQKFKEFCTKNFNWDDITEHLMKNLKLSVEDKDFQILRERQYLNHTSVEDLKYQYYQRNGKCNHCQTDIKKYNLMKRKQKV